MACPCSVQDPDDDFVLTEPLLPSEFEIDEETLRIPYMEELKRAESRSRVCRYDQRYTHIAKDHLVQILRETDELEVPQRLPGKWRLIVGENGHSCVAKKSPQEVRTGCHSVRVS